MWCHILIFDPQTLIIFESEVNVAIKKNPSRDKNCADEQKVVSTDVYTAVKEKL